MDKKTYIIIGTLLLIIILIFFFVFWGKEEDPLPVDPEKETFLEERKKELAEIKDKDFYEDNIIKHLGWSEEELKEVHGLPDRVTPHYREGEEFYYEDLNASFLFTGDDGFVNNIYLYPGAEILDIEVGMTFDEIEEVLGEPRFRGFDEMEEKYMMVYFLGDATEGLGELELYIAAEGENAPTERIDVLWKEYWSIVD